jgi:cell wall-associated NlpC family hydrolase
LSFDLSRWRAFAAASRRPVLTFGVFAATSALLVGVLPAAADAAQSGSTTASVAQAQQKLDAISITADRAVEAYDQAQTALDGVTAQAQAAKDAAAREQSVVDAAKVGLDALAVARYEGTSSSPTLAVLTSDNPQTFLAQAQVLSQVSHYESASLTTVVNANRALVGLQTSAAQALAKQQAAVAALAASKAAVDKILTQQQSLLGTLQAQAAQQAANDQAAAETALVARQHAVSRAATRPALAVAPKAVPANDNNTAVAVAAAPAAEVAAVPAAVPAHAGGASAVLSYAYAQVGKPYRFGGAGPGSYDCSGLTMRAWGAAGVSLSHSAAAQQHSGRRVPMSQLQPGDLIFWGSPAYHVGIYVGGGQIIDAPHTGTVIKVRAIWGSPSSAVRP